MSLTGALILLIAGIVVAVLTAGVIHTLAVIAAIVGFVVLLVILVTGHTRRVP